MLRNVQALKSKPNPRTRARGGNERVRAAAQNSIELLEGRVLLSTATAIDHSAGFTGAGGADVQLNGAASNPGSVIQFLDGVTSSQTSSAFDKTPQGINTFDTTFNFDFGGLAQADGIVFTLQNDPRGAQAIGTFGLDIGYKTIANSIGVKFDLWQDGGPNATTSGVYVNGNPPADDPRQAMLSTTPAPIGTSVNFKTNPDGTSTGIDFHGASGATDQYQVHLVYDGTTLTETLTDVTLSASATQTYNINIPSVIGSNTAYAGFTAGDGGAFSLPELTTWTYSGTVASQVPTPILSAAPGVGGEAPLVFNASPNGYEIDASSNGGATFAKLTNVAPNVANYDATGLDPTKSYQFKIKALGNGSTTSDSAFSNIVTVNAAGTAPVLSGSSPLPGQADLTFTEAATDETGYQLVGSTDGGVTFNNLATFAPGASHALITGLDPTKTYQLKLDALGNGTTTTATSFSNVVTVNAAGPATSPALDFSGGFANAAGQLQLNGVATLTGATGTPANALELTHGVNLGEAASAFSTSRVGVDTFDTTYQFTFGAVHNPDADGFVFTLQNDPNGIDALGGGGGGKGYAGLQNSFGVYFNLYPGLNQTGTAQAGVLGPATDLTMDPTTGGATGIDFHANKGDTFQAHLSYDGTTLTETVTDQTLIAAGMPGTFTTTYAVGIPMIVGNHAAFAGFTGGDGGATSQQDILNWKYSGTGAFTLPLPVAVATSGAPGVVDVGWTDNLPASGFEVDESVNGGAFTPVATNLPVVQNHYELTGLDPTVVYTFQVVALPIANVPKLISNPVMAQPVSATPGPVNFSSGFSTPDGLTINGLMLNGGAVPTGAGGTPANALQITSNVGNVGSSAFTTSAQSISGFDTTFDFTFPATSTPPADGFAFVLQNSPAGPSALGVLGGGLGYGPVGNVNLNNGGIPNSVAIKFDLYQNDVEGTNSTGLFVNGDSPSSPIRSDGPEATVDLTPSGVVLGKPDTYHAELSYNGSTLHETLTDTTTGKTFTHDYSINLSQYIKGNFAYVGFTGGTGGLSAEQDILNWTYTPVTSTAVNLVSTALNDGTTAAGTTNQTQRSEVRDIVLKFDHAVTLGAGSVTLSLLNTGGSGKNDGSAATDVSAALGTPTSADGGLTWVYTFNKTDTTAVDSTGSLNDGIYTVTVNPASVTGGTVGGTNLSTTFHRLFGDINGDKIVNNFDYLKFKASFLSSSTDAKYNSDFDYNGDGMINNVDYLRFKARFLKQFTY